MPHFLASHITLPPMPFVCGEYEFVYEATMCNHPSQSLILVRYTPKLDFISNEIDNTKSTKPRGAKHNSEDCIVSMFFLRKSIRAHNVIIKCEKTSRNQPTGIIKNALKILAQHQSTLISHNLNNNSPRQNLNSPYFKPIEYFLDFASPCLIEVGFGSGRHLLHLAQSHKELICVICVISLEVVSRIFNRI